MKEKMHTVEIYTDGACSGNPGPGGWCAILIYGSHKKKISHGVENTTNNRMELEAVIQGLRALKKKCCVTVHSDSKYVKNGITIWIKKWLLNEWRTSGKKPVKNIDQWKELLKLTDYHSVEWNFVPGHSGIPENEECDFLARKEINKLKSKNI